jgi:hypothetical protein
MMIEDKEKPAYVWPSGHSTIYQDTMSSNKRKAKVTTLARGIDILNTVPVASMMSLHRMRHDEPMIPC